MTDSKPQSVQSQHPHVDPILNREAALAFVGHDPDFLNELLGAFHHYRPAIVERIESAVRDADAAALREAAHQLKGALGNFHARAAVQTARQLEEAGFQAEFVHTDSLCAQLDNDLDSLSNAISDLLGELNANGAH